MVLFMDRNSRDVLLDGTLLGRVADPSQENMDLCLEVELVLPTSAPSRMEDRTCKVEFVGLSPKHGSI